MSAYLLLSSMCSDMDLMNEEMKESGSGAAGEEESEKTCLRGSEVHRVSWSLN